MSDRDSFRHLITHTKSEVYRFPLRHSEIDGEALDAEKAQRRFARLRRRVFLARAALVTMVAVAGEIAALTVASVLDLGMTATGFALAGVVLSAVWPLSRCVP